MDYGKPSMILAILILAISFGSISVTEASADASQYEVKELDTYLMSEDEFVKKEYRFYKDLDSIPFITLDDLYQTYSGYEMAVTSDGDGRYTYTNPLTGESAVIDLNNGEFISDDYDSFKEMVLSEDAVPPFLMPESTIMVRGPAEHRMSFFEYSIPFYEDGNVWMPLTTAADIFAGTHQNYAYVISDMVYVGDAYILTSNIEDMPEPLKEFMYEAYERISYADERPLDLVDYTYNELCMVIDNNYGKPETAALGKELQKSKLDYVLTHHSESTKKIKEWLKSPSYPIYLTGVFGLWNYLYDSGHTMFFFGLLDDDRLEWIYKLLNTIELPDITDREDIVGRIYEAKYSMLGEGTYHEKGDTAIFSFDVFFTDKAAWKEYYENGGKLPDDTYGNFIKAIQTANMNPEIKNFVVDLSTNEGGWSDSAMAILAAMTGKKPYMNDWDSDSDSIFISRVMIDINLDGIIDERDLRKISDYNFAILCTKASFSCGNLVPIYAKEMGIMVLEERSGGGCCSTEMAGTVDCIVATLSSTCNLVDSKFHSVESGVSPHVVLVDTRDYYSDLTVMYDIDRLSEEINSFYASKNGNNPFYVAIIVTVLILLGSAVFFRRK